MDKNTRDILEALTFIKERMATKEDVRDIIREEVPPMIEAAIHKTVAPKNKSPSRWREQGALDRKICTATDAEQRISGCRP